jgi:hypothetical protein
MTAKQLLTEANLHATHWGKRIITAEEFHGTTPSDLSDSGEWTTCACGKQDPRIPRTKSGAPIDEYLEELGVAFYQNVCAHRFLEAAETLIAIERRAAEILAGLPA